MANRVSAYEVLFGKSPDIIYIKNNDSTSDNNSKVLDEFISYFGEVYCIDDCLVKIQNKGYAFYFNSEYDTNDTIENIYNEDGANCTDASQLFYRLGCALGYDVQFVHVLCTVSGIGHIRLRLRRGDSDWFYRDPAAVLDGECVECNWCSDGDIIAINPDWIFSDLYQ